MKNISLLVSLIAIVIAVGGVLLALNVSHAVGSTGSRYPDGLSTSSVSPALGKLLIGALGTNIGTVIYGTCYLQADFSITATSTGMVDCVSSSFKSGDTVIIDGFATSSVAQSRQYSIQGTGSASTTNGFAPVRMTNWTGANATPSAGGTGLGSSTPFVIIRP